MECKEKQIPELYLIAGRGGNVILKGIASSPLKERLLIRNDQSLHVGHYQKELVNHLVFFASEEQIEDTIRELKALFPMESAFENPKTGETECLQVFLCGKESGNQGNPRVFLEIYKKPYRIPVQLEMILFRGQSGYPQEEILDGNPPKQKAIAYCKFNSEEYLARCFYEVLDSLEWLDDMLWYQEIYDILAQKAVNGRKVWDSLHRLLEEQPISFLENRLNRIKDYADYNVMEEKWQALYGDKAEGYPEWQEVIQLLGEFYTPIFEGVLKDEIFFGDWMPQLKRYLD